MTHEQALDKVAKLLRLAKSTNQHEAALAASRAQEIMDRYKIESTAAELASQSNGSAQPDEPIKDFRDDPLENVGRLATWKGRLLSAVTRANQCRMYYLSMGGMSIVGRPSDAATCRYIYTWLARQVDDLAKVETKGYGRSFAANWRIGCVETIHERLQAQQKATRQAVQTEHNDNPLALVLVNNALAKIEQRDQSVVQWMKGNLRLHKTSARVNINENARAAGRAAGQRIQLGSAKGTIGRGVAGQLS